MSKGSSGLFAGIQSTTVDSENAFSSVGEMDYTLLPEDLRTDVELDRKFDNLQARYDSLFINNAHEFTYVGFQSEGEKQQFLKEWSDAVEELRTKTGGRYEIVDDIGKSF